MKTRIKKYSGKKGFTLVELMVVAVIVAILAAVAIPLMSANVTRAIATEAEAALGTARSNLRAMYAETKDYSKDSEGVSIVGGALVTKVPGFSAGDLDGRYFSDACYSVTSANASNYLLTATGSASTAPKKDKVATIVITLNQDGDFTRTGL
jgi:prepilin-type N-terminal cleavage/methylation domain-containing protein